MENVRYNKIIRSGELNILKQYRVYKASTDKEHINTLIR